MFVSSALLYHHTCYIIWWLKDNWHPLHNTGQIWYEFIFTCTSNYISILCDTVFILSVLKYFIHPFKSKNSQFFLFFFFFLIYLFISMNDNLIFTLNLQICYSVIKHNFQIDHKQNKLPSIDYLSWIHIFMGGKMWWWQRWRQTNKFIEIRQSFVVWMNL